MWLDNLTIRWKTNITIAFRKKIKMIEKIPIDAMNEHPFHWMNLLYLWPKLIQKLPRLAFQNIDSAYDNNICNSVRIYSQHLRGKYIYATYTNYQNQNWVKKTTILKTVIYMWATFSNIISFIYRFQYGEWIVTGTGPKSNGKVPISRFRNQCP